MSGPQELPLDLMLRDADIAWEIQTGGRADAPPDLLGDLACHVRALVAALAGRDGEPKP